MIRECFGAVVSAVLAGLSFGAAPDEVLARIIVLAQFTRNIHRDTPQRKRSLAGVNRRPG